MKPQECRTINRHLKHLLEMVGWLNEIKDSPYLSEPTKNMLGTMHEGSKLAYRELDTAATEAGYKDPYRYR